MAHDVGLTVITDVDDATVFRKELPYRMISSDTAVFTESRDDLVL